MSQDEFKSQSPGSDQKQAPKAGLLRNSQEGQYNYSLSKWVNQEPNFNPMQPLTHRWVILCEYADVKEDGLYPFEINKDEYSYPIVLINKVGQFYALHDQCPHRRVKLSSQGYLDGENIYCGLHHWGFKIDNGAHLLPTGICVDHYPVRVDENQVLIGVTW